MKLSSSALTRYDTHSWLSVIRIMAMVLDETCWNNNDTGQLLLGSFTKWDNFFK
jgi:hypothetical protein